jgi:mono/diheme cytochrome c family protein
MRHFIWGASSLVLSFILSTVSFSTSAHASTAPLSPDWSKNAVIDPYGRPNPYGWDDITLARKIRNGQISALSYPVTTTGILLPAKPAYKFLNAQPGDPLFGLIKTVLSLSSDFQNYKGFWEWMGLHNYPDTDKDIPYPGGVKPDYPMGLSYIKRGHTEGLTFSCAVCHSAELFGKPVLGMTNRFPNANMAFVEGQKLFHGVSPTMLAIFTGANSDEVALYKASRENVTSIGTKKPATLGLDTALAQVSLSIAKRAPSAWAERDHAVEAHPRPNLLDTKVADSKPAVWWTTKYKTHWLSDGGIVSGSPVITNLMWNELGRGGDLRDLDQWIHDNEEAVEDLTTAIFATKSPKWSDYLGENTVNVARAKNGEQLFLQNCAHCHGQYEKAWSLSAADFSSRRSANPELNLIDTLRVKYFAQTTTVDVGTDAGRREGMKAMAEALNPLAMSSEYGISNEVQDGYVPPPLEGIFARYPYLHNNSVPNLCALMTNPSQRPVTYTSGKPIDPNTDYDQDCVGYPTGSKVPANWLSAKDAPEHLFDTRKEGLSNSGHFNGIFTRADGTERYTDDQKKDLREFLKTL